MADLLTAKALREQRAPLAARIQELRETVSRENRDFTSEERGNWEAVNKDYDALTGQIGLAERAEQVAADQAGRAGHADVGRQDYDGSREGKERAAQDRRERREVVRLGWNAAHVTEEDRALVLQGWVRAQSGLAPKKRHQDAARKCGMDLRRRHLDLHLRDTRQHNEFRQKLGERRAQALTPNTAGGFLVPEGFVQNLEVALLAYANVRMWADVMRTSSGQDLPWPTVNDTAQKGFRLQENATVTEKDMTFGQTILHAFKYSSGMVQVPVELMEDSAFDLAALLGELLGIRIGRAQADDFTFGLGGGGQPQGYVTGATQGVQAASSAALAADDLYKLKHAVDPAYRSQPGVGWTFHDQILLTIKLLKDGLGRYLWQPGLSGDAPDTVDGDPYFINQSQASTIASGTKSVVYGALRKYKIRDVSQIRMRRLVERFADSDQEGFVMFMRGDGQLLDAGTHPLKYLVH